MKWLVFVVACSCVLVGCAAQQGVISNSGYDFFAEDVVSKTRNGIDNIERFYAFFANVQSGEYDQVRIVEHTIEGDPIYVDVRHSNDEINVKIDYSEDTYGNGEVIKATCNQLNAIEVGSRTDYYVSDCSDDEQYIIFSDY
ncbi:DUF4362 domain-containing protein [Metasolibacillus sp. FSL H7-0170]|uniref:DUF4362 domain-containing protein n=1 Tax=Metasolibacillus TaxID=2703677 RepID=UPI000796FA2B|nr:DUF4362 domain-containing protein [Metasolibacillus fluoroglycofenilyticus]KYG91780.1 hypothetical protein A0U40_02235 [[Bacillus] sp. KCTC 13219]